MLGLLLTDAVASTVPGELGGRPRLGALRGEEARQHAPSQPSINSVDVADL